MLSIHQGQRSFCQAFRRSQSQLPCIKAGLSHSFSLSQTYAFWRCRNLRWREARTLLLYPSLLWWLCWVSETEIIIIVCLIWFFTSHQQSFSYVGTVLPVWTSTKLGFMCLAQRHNAVTPVRLEPTAPLSRVKHSTTEPLGSLKL